MQEGYKENLAYIHDAGFGDLARHAAPVIIAALQQNGFSSGLVVDLGCGSGILAEKLLQAGYDVLGIDISEAMIALARKRAPRAQFRAGSLLDAELPRCAAVAATGECFNYLFDPRNNGEKLGELFRRIYRALESNGLLIFDIAEPGRVPGDGFRRTCSEGDDWAVIATSEEDRQRRLLTRRITSFRKVGKWYHRDTEVHRLRLIPRAEVTGQLRSIGFKVRLLRGYGELQFPRGLSGFLARKLPE